METEVTVDAVERFETRSDKTRWVLRDAGGREFTTFRPRVGEAAERHQGARARIAYHEEDRNGFHNVYLDSIEAAAPAAAEPGEQAVGDSDPDELYEKLEPFKRRVSEDIRSHGDGDGD